MVDTVSLFEWVAISIRNPIMEFVHDGSLWEKFNFNEGATKFWNELTGKYEGNCRWNSNIYLIHNLP